MTVGSNDNRVAPNGWVIDGDGWFVRAMRPGDRQIGFVPSFGFTCEGAVFVREPQHCHDYDRGVVTPASRREASR